MLFEIRVGVVIGVERLILRVAAVMLCHPHDHAPCTARSITYLIYCSYSSFQTIAKEYKKVNSLAPLFT